MPLFGSLYIGASGLQTSQNTLNTTAHNMANTDTKGYTRQQILLGTRSYINLSSSASAISYQQYGLGVVYSQTRQVRDVFLDKTYRKETGRCSFYEVNTKVIEEIEDLFGEFQGVEFSAALENLWTAMEELVKSPCDMTNQNMFVSRCDQFLTKALRVYDGLCEQQDNLNAQVEKTVEKINEYGEQLVAINKKIMRLETGDTEHANDLRDQRNLILDELAKLGKIQYEEDFNGVVSVKFEGVDFVTSDLVNTIELHTDKETGFHTPYWKQLANYKNNKWGEPELDLEAARVYNPTQKISTTMNTDIGALRATLLARGEKRATYQDLEDSEAYNTDIYQSLLMNVEAEFDRLIHYVATTINDALREAAMLEPDTGYLKDEDGNPYQMFELISMDPEKGFSVSNMIVNESLKREPGRLSFRTKDGKEDKAAIERMLDGFEAETYMLNPNLQTKTNIRRFYDALINQVSNTGKTNKDFLDAQEATVNETYSAREQVLGVSSDEEMEFMIKFQNAYNASSRYINVIDDMIEHIINTLGR